MEVICHNCKENFTTKGDKRKFCSRRCYFGFYKKYPKGNFSIEEIQLIQNLYPKYGAEYCSRFISKPTWQIQKKAGRLGLKIDKQIRQKILKDNAKATWEKRYAVKTRSEYNRFLSLFSNPYFIYTLGFLWGDGHVEYKQSRISIKINSDDAKELYNIFVTALPFTVNTRQNQRYHIKTRNCTEFRFSNKLISGFLCENDFHIKSTASANKIISKIPLELRYLWWRGYSDADGCFYRNGSSFSNYFSIASTYEQNWDFIQDIENTLSIIFRIRRNHNKTTNHKHSVAILSKISDIQKFGNYIYNNFQNDNIGLQRKYEIFKQIYYRPEKHENKRRINIA